QASTLNQLRYSPISARRLPPRHRRVKLKHVRGPRRLASTPRLEPVPHSRYLSCIRPESAYPQKWQPCLPAPGSRPPPPPTPPPPTTARRRRAASSASSAATVPPGPTPRWVWWPSPRLSPPFPDPRPAGPHPFSALFLPACPPPYPASGSCTSRASRYGR